MGTKRPFNDFRKKSNIEKIPRIDKRNFTILMSNGKEVGLSQDRKMLLLERLE